MKSSPPWTICVVTSVSEELPKCGELANALLYGDAVVWLPTDLPLLFAAASEHSIASAEMKELAEKFLVYGYRPLVNELQEIQETLKEVVISIPDSLMREPSKQLLEMLAKTISPDSGSNSGPLDHWIRQKIFKLLHSHTVEMALGDSSEITQLMQSTHACFVQQEGPYRLQSPPSWDAYRATEHVMSALSRVLLPDISSLPIPEVASLRDKVKDTLDPMRAECLRLTEHLRQMVNDESSDVEVAREAENLIKTRVEPVVREADKHARDILRGRWRTFFQGTLKCIGLVGLGFLIPKFFEDAIKQGVNIAAESATQLGKVQPPTNGARFVLEVRRNLISQSVE